MPALIEKFSDGDQLFQCYKPTTKRRLDLCMETATTTKRMIKIELDEKPVTRVEQHDKSADGEHGSNFPHN